MIASGPVGGAECYTVTDGPSRPRRRAQSLTPRVGGSPRTAAHMAAAGGPEAVPKPMQDPRVLPILVLPSREKAEAAAAAAVQAAYAVVAVTPFDGAAVATASALEAMSC